MQMQAASHFLNTSSKIQVLLADIDDTMTSHGELSAEAYEALWSLRKSGVQVLPVTGRPAGWCDMIARFWPVAGVVGENGGFYFRYNPKTKKMIRQYVTPEKTQLKNQKKLQSLGKKILKAVPGSAISADQFSRQMDLAIDFCEDVPALPRKKVLQIQSLFEKAGAQAKISSIHVNGWFGSYTKLSQSLQFLKKELKISEAHAKKVCAYVGDSPNDEPMWSYFPHSFGVANVMDFEDQIKNPPTYILSKYGGQGFADLARLIIRNNRK